MPGEQAIWFVYLIECRGGSIYTGITTDVAARYATHVAGKGARYTRMHPPEKLLVAIECTDRSSALKAEYHIKRLNPSDKRRLAEQPAAFSQTTPAVAAPDFHV